MVGSIDKIELNDDEISAYIKKVYSGQFFRAG